MKRFFRSVQLIKWLHYRPFSDKLPTNSEYSKETFFLESVFDEVRNSRLQGCSDREKKDSFTKTYLQFSKFQNILFFLSTTRIDLWLSSLLGCRLYSCNSFKRKLRYMRFSDNSPKFSAQLFQNALRISSLMKFKRVIDYIVQSLY